MLHRERPARAQTPFRCATQRCWKFLFSRGATKLFWIRSGAAILAALFWIAQIQTVFKGGPSGERQRGVAKGARRGRWPTVFIIGSPKAGTTSLSDVMFASHWFCRPRSNDGNKEVHWLNRKEVFEKGVEWYLAHFGHDPKCLPQDAYQRYVDASPTYLHSPGAAARLNASIPPSLKPELRFIVILREPVARQLSWFNHLVGQRPVPGNDTKTSGRDFEQEVQLSLERRGENWGGLESGRYARQLEEWLAFFDRRQILVLSFASLTSDSSSTLRHVGEFLGVSDWREGGGHALVHSNEQPRPGKLEPRDVDPQVCADMARFFAAKTPRLYTLLAQPPRPPSEPPFEPFLPPCPSRVY